MYHIFGHILWRYSVTSWTNGLIYGRYLQFRSLKWPLSWCLAGKSNVTQGNSPSNSWYLRRKKDRWYSIPSLSCLPRAGWEIPELNGGFQLGKLSMNGWMFHSHVWSLPIKQSTFLIVSPFGREILLLIHPTDSQSRAFQELWWSRPEVISTSLPWTRWMKPSFPVSNADPRYSKTAWIAQVLWTGHRSHPNSIPNVHVALSEHSV